MKQPILLLLAIGLLITSCGKETPKLTDSGLNPLQFTSVSEDGKEKTQLYVMKNANGMEVCVVNTGMRIVSMMVPDKNKEKKDVVLGFDKIDPYKNLNNYFGAVTGRYSNVIANGVFSLDRVSYTLRRNASLEYSFNGGPNGFHVAYFQIEQVNDAQLIGTYLSKNKEEGYPGDLSVTVTYTLTNDNALDIRYEAFTNMPTVVNLSNHSCFNLSGDFTLPVLDHQLFIDANNYTPTENKIPTGAIAPVAGTVFDFTQARPVGEKFNDPEFENLQGYDLNFVLNHTGDIKTQAAKVYSPVSGISLEVYTTEPGIQLSTCNEMEVTGKFGQVYGSHSAICLDTQHFPDSPNRPEFPSTVLRPGEVYVSHTIYKFGIQR